MEPAIEINNVSKAYPVFDSPAERLGELLTFQKLRLHRDFWALRNVSCRIPRGETFCLIGENGSGKSTLLQIIAGILEPTSGFVRVNGRVAALLELGAGFNPEFSGRENVYLNAAVLGLRRAEIDARYGDIVAFADIGDFIDQPVKTYSSGMAVRLGFAVAIHCEPQILLVDEALAVGDVGFRQRCLQKVEELRDKGLTIVIVSHSPQDVESVGDRAMWLDRGEAREIGPAGRVLENYLLAMAEKGRSEEKIDIPNIDARSGDHSGEIVAVSLLDALGRQASVLNPSETGVIRVSVVAREDLPKPVIGLVMRNQVGLTFFECDTESLGFALPSLARNNRFTIDFRLAFPELYPAHFSFSIYLMEGRGPSARVCDRIENALAAPMMSRGRQIYGYIHLLCEIEIQQTKTQQNKLELV